MSLRPRKKGSSCLEIRSQTQRSRKWSPTPPRKERSWRRPPWPRCWRAARWRLIEANAVQPSLRWCTEN